MGSIDAARADLDQALDVLMRERDALPQGVERLSFAESVRRVAIEFVSLEVAAGRPDRALVAADRIRSWDLRLAASAGDRLDVARLRDALAPDTTVLYYSIGDTESYVWAIRRASLQLHRLSANRLELQRLVETGDRATVESPGGRRLYEFVLRPVAETLTGRKAVIVPDGPLHGIPFAGLPGRAARFLIATTLSARTECLSLLVTSRRLRAFVGEARKW